MSINQKIISLAILTILVSIVAGIYTTMSFKSVVATLFGTSSFFCGMLAGYTCYMAIQIVGKKDER